MRTHIDTLEGILADLTRVWHHTHDGQLAHAIYGIRRATDHLKEI